MSRILVVGGAGYIGSHMMKGLTKAGHEPVAFDNLSTGAVDVLIYGELVEGELEFDHSKYRVSPQKLLDSKVMNELVWSAKTRFEDGLDGVSREFIERGRLR